MTTPVRAAVVAANGASLSLITDDGYKHPLPAGAMHNGRDLLDMLEPLIGNSVTLIVPDPWHAPDAATVIAEAGWRMTTPPADVETINGWSAWTTYFRPGKAVHVGILPMIDDDKTPLFRRDDDPRVIARRLCDFQRVLRVSYRITPGVTGGGLLKGMYGRLGREAQPLWVEHLDNPDLRGVGDLLEHRTRDQAERECVFIHAFDIHGAYLNAAGMADLAWGPLAHRPSAVTVFDPAQCGYWRVTYASTHAPKWPVSAPEIVPDTRVLEDGTVWLTTPIVRLLVEYGARLEFRDSWVAAPVRNGSAPATRRLLRPWSETIRDARRNLSLMVPNVAERAAMAATLKRVPNETIGLFNPHKGTGAIVRNVWAWTIRDLNRALLLRKVATIGTRTGMWPVRIKTDALYYASSLEPADCAAALGITLPVEWSPGRWHYTGTTPAGMWTDPELELVDA